MTTQTLSPVLRQKFWDSNGNPLVAGLVFTYIAGTNTKLATYSDPDGTFPNSNPIVLDFRGEAPIYIPPNVAYKFVIAPATDTDPPGNPIMTIDEVINSALLTLYGGVDTGSADNYILNFVASFSAYTDGIVIYWIPSHSNTGPSTVNVNGLGPVAILNQDGSPLYEKELIANTVVTMMYKGTGFVLVTPLGAAAFSAQRIISSQAMPPNTVTTCIFNTASINQGGAYNLGTGIFVAPVYGIYHFDAVITLLPSGTDCVLNAIYFSKNNATAGAGERFDIGIGLSGALYSNTGNQMFFAGGVTIEMDAGDTMRIKWDAGNSVVSQNNMGLVSCFAGAKVA